MSPRSRTGLVFAGLGVVVATVSLVVPLAYDEGNWVGDVRRWTSGESLYTDIPENKAPLLMALVRGLDALPGSFVTARALYVAIAVCALGLAARSIAARSGWSDPRATALGVILGAAAAAQAVYTVNFEVPAATLIMLGLANVATGRGLAGGALAAAAAGFDIRALALLPGVALFSRAASTRAVSRRCVAAIALIAGAWAAAVLLVPDLRYSLLELNVATRAATTSWNPLELGYAMLRGALFPAAAVAVLGIRRGRESGDRFRASWVTLLAGGTALSVASLQPFDKYWTLILPGLAVMAASRGSREPLPDRRALLGPVALAAALGFGFSSAYAAVSNLDQSRLVGRYERAARFIDETLPPGATVARFDTQPFLSVFLPARDGSPVTVLDFAVADTSRHAHELMRIERSIDHAVAVVDDGALSVPEGAVHPAYREIWRIFDARLDEFPCLRTAGGLTIRYRREICPAATASGS